MATNKISPRATKKISQLDSAESLSGSELVPIVQEQTTRKATMDQIGQKAIERVRPELDEVIEDFTKEGNVVLAGMGYLPPVPYASGLSVNSTRFTVIREGQVYAPSDPVPFTTGAWDAGQWRLVQGVTGADLAAEYGAGMVGVAIDPSEYKFNTVGAGLSSLHRAGKTGVFGTDDYLPAEFRGGRLAYAKDVSGGARLLTDLTRFMPKGALCDATPTESRSYQFEVTADQFINTSNPLIKRAVISGVGVGWMSDGERPRSAVFSKTDGRMLTDERHGYIAAEYGASVRFSQGLGGLVVEVKLPTSDKIDVVAQVFFAAPSEVKKVFIDPVSGNDLFDGTSFEWPKKTFASALALTPDVVFIKPGVYDLQNYPGTYTDARDLAIRCVGGSAIFISRLVSFSAWTHDSGSTYVTTCSGSPSVIGGVDLGFLDEMGLPTFLHLAPTLAECRSTPGTAFWEAGGRKFYVHLSDGRAPTSDLVRPVNSNTLFRHSAPGRKVYLENIIAVGGSGGTLSARDAGSESVLACKGCAAVGMYVSNGFDIKDVGLFIGIDCAATNNANDGFNYTALNGVSPHFIEVNCTSYRNRAPGTGNGSTSHNDCIGFRLNTRCYGNTGPGIADVNDAVTYNVSVASNYNGPSENASGIRADGNAVVYVDGGSAIGNAGADVEGTLGATVWARDLYVMTSGDGVLGLPVTQ